MALGALCGTVLAMFGVTLTTQPVKVIVVCIAWALACELLRVHVGARREGEREP